MQVIYRGGRKLRMRNAQTLKNIERKLKESLEKTIHDFIKNLRSDFISKTAIDDDKEQWIEILDKQVFELLYGNNQDDELDEWDTEKCMMATAKVYLLTMLLMLEDLEDEMGND